MNYLQSYRIWFDSPKWWQTLLAGAVCVLVPIVGAIVLLGYAFEVIESWHRGRRQGYKEFDLNQLVKYMLRGLWPFLVQLVFSLPVGLFFGVAYLVGIFTVLQPQGSRPPPPSRFFAFFGSFYGALFLVSMLLAVVTVPLTLRAGLAQSFPAAFSLSFFRDFLARTWKETILAELFLVVSGMVVMFAGLLVLCVGIYPAGALISLARYHLYYQLYELYLQRGGTPVPLKEELLEAQPAGPRVLDEPDEPYDYE